MSPSADTANARHNFTKAPPAVPKGFYVRVYRGPASSFPPVATAKFDVGYHAIPLSDPRQNQNWYPDSTASQHVPKSFSTASSTMPSRSQLTDSTTVNRGYETNTRPTKTGFSIYQSSSDTYVYEASISSKSDLSSRSEFDASTTTFSPSSLFSPAMSTDSLTTSKSPGQTDSSLPSSASRPTTPTNSRGSFASSQNPGHSQVQSTLRGIFRNQTPLDPRTENDFYAAHATTARPAPTFVPTGANPRNDGYHLRDAGPISNRSTTPIRLSSVTSTSGLGDRSTLYSSPTTPLSDEASPTYAPSTVSELEQLERDQLARTNAEYNAASSTSTYLPKRRNSVLVSAPAPPNRANGLPPQIFPNMPLRSSPEQHSYVPAHYTVEASRTSSFSQSTSSGEVQGSSTQKRSPQSLPYQYVHTDSEDMSVQRDQSAPLPPPSPSPPPAPTTGWVEEYDTRQASRRSPETRSPSTVPQFINEGQSRSRYIPASRTVSPKSQPLVPERVILASSTFLDKEVLQNPPLETPSQAVGQSWSNGSGITQRERRPSISVPPGPLAPQPPACSGPAIPSAPRGSRDAPPASIPSSNASPPLLGSSTPSREHAVNSRGRGSGKYVPRDSTVTNGRVEQSPPRSPPDRAPNASNLPSTRGVSSVKASQEPSSETSPGKYYTPSGRDATPASLVPKGDPSATPNATSQGTRAGPSRRVTEHELPAPTTVTATSRLPADNTPQPASWLHQSSSATSASNLIEVSSSHPQLFQRSPTQEPRVVAEPAISGDLPVSSGPHGTTNPHHPDRISRALSSTRVTTMASNEVRQRDERWREVPTSDTDSGSSGSSTGSHRHSPRRRHDGQNQRGLSAKYSSKNVDRSRSPPRRDYPKAAAATTSSSPPSMVAYPPPPAQPSPERGRVNSVVHSSQLSDPRVPTTLAPPPASSRSQHVDSRTSPPRSQSVLAYGPESRPSTTLPNRPQPADIRNSPPRSQTPGYRPRERPRMSDEQEEVRNRAAAEGTLYSAPFFSSSPGRAPDAPRDAGQRPADNTTSSGSPGRLQRTPFQGHPLPEPQRRHTDGDATARDALPEPLRRGSDGDQFLYTDKNSLTLFRTVRWNDNLICPSPIFASQRRKGWFNRKGDQLWTNNGAYKSPVRGQEYPPDLDAYPEPGEGWMNEEGVRIDMGHRLIPKTPLRSALKQAKA